MSEPTSERPQGVIPHLSIDGAAAAIEFYKKALGAVEVMRVPADDGKRLMHASLKINGADVYVVDHFPEFCPSKGKISPPVHAGATSVTIHLEVADCDAAVKQAEEAGATVIMAPWDAFWGARYAQVMDPFGHSWSFAHPQPGGCQMNPAQQ